jgi:predicted Ser/Thr protein kinase
MPESSVSIGNALVARGVLTVDKLRQALLEHARQPKVPFDEFLVAQGYVTREQLAAKMEEPLAPFGKYDLLREIGRGGMGVVYEARDRELGRLVALKLMLGRRDRPVAPQEEERFVREAQLAAALPPHPGIVGVFEAGIVEGRRFIAMERILGSPLTIWRAAANLRAQVELLRDMALALEHAHQHGVIHRDLKPDNVLVDATGKPHITDFGLAKAVGQDTQLSLTSEGMVVGTPAYMSPEQALGQKTIDGRADIWALGVLLYEALTGRQPFVGSTAVEILMKASKNAAPSPSRVMSKEALAALDPGLEHVCLKALARNVNKRYATAAGYAADLDRWLKGEPVKAPPSTTTVKGPAKRSALVPAAAVMGSIVAIGVAGYFIWKRDVAPPHPVVVVVPAPVPAKPPPRPSVDCLAMADMDTGVLRGAWHRDGKDLVSDQVNGLAVFSLPVEPPEEYDVRVEFTPRGAEPDINVVGLWDGHPFQWYVGSQGSTWYGFGWIDGQTGFGHPSGLRRSGLMTTGQRHVTVLEVRRDRLTGLLDGKTLVVFATIGHTLGVSEELLPRFRTRLALTTWHNPTVFHAVELTPH